MKSDYWEKRAKAAEDVIKEFVRITGKKEDLTNVNQDVVLSIENKDNEVLYNKIAIWTQFVLMPNHETIKNGVDTLIECGFLKYEI